MTYKRGVGWVPQEVYPCKTGFVTLEIRAAKPGELWCDFNGINARSIEHVSRYEWHKMNRQTYPVTFGDEIVLVVTPC